MWFASVVVAAVVVSVIELNGNKRFLPFAFYNILIVCMYASTYDYFLITIQKVRKARQISLWAKFTLKIDLIVNKFESKSITNEVSNSSYALHCRIFKVFFIFVVVFISFLFYFCL